MKQTQRSAKAAVDVGIYLSRSTVPNRKSRARSPALPGGNIYIPNNKSQNQQFTPGGGGGNCRDALHYTTLHYTTLHYILTLLYLLPP